MGVERDIGTGQARRELDFSLTGRMLPPLWIAAGLSFSFAAVVVADSGRAAGLTLGVLGVIVGSALTAVNWSTVPVGLPA